MRGRGVIREGGRSVQPSGAVLFVLGVALATVLLPPSALAASFRLTLSDQNRLPLAGTPVRAIPLGGGRPKSATTSPSGEVVFLLTPGTYRFRAQYLGYAFTSRSVAVPRTRRLLFPIPRRAVTVAAEAFCGDQTAPLPGIPVTVRRTGSGLCVAGPALTDALGRAAFTLPSRSYYFEVVSGGGAHRSDDFTWEDREIRIAGGKLVITVLHGGNPLPGVSLGLKSPTGEDLGIQGSSDAAGLVSFVLPPGGYLAEADHDDARPVTPLLTVRESEVTSVSFEMREGREPAVALRGAARQIPDGSDLVEIPLRVSDEDGDGCRLRVEYSLDGETWGRATLSPDLRVEKVGEAGTPEVDNAAAFQVGNRFPLNTDHGPNSVTVFWDAGRDLPKGDTVTARLRLTANDGRNATVLQPEGTFWAGVGPSPPELGISATPDDSYSPSLAVDSLGRPHVVWMELLPEGEAVAYLHWNGLQWVDADGTGRESMIVWRTTGAMFGLSLALDRDDRPRIAWDGPAGDRRSIFYLEWDGARWRGMDGRPGEAGPILSSPRSFAYPHLETDLRNGSHLTFSTVGEEPTVIFHLLAGEPRPSMPLREEELAAATAPECDGVAMRVDGRGRPHLVWTESAGGGTAVRHLFLDGGEWRALAPQGDAVPTVSPAYLPALALDDEGERPWLFWVHADGGSTRILSSSWNGVSWTAPETVGPPGATLPAASMLRPEVPAVGYVQYADGSWFPGFVVRDKSWGPWPGFPERVTAAVTPSYSISTSASPGGVPLLAIDGHAGQEQEEEIYVFTPSYGILGLDTAPPAAPGQPEAALSPDSNQVIVTLGAPAVERNFLGYVVEASLTAAFAPPLSAVDWRSEPRLRQTDPKLEEGILLRGLLWGEEYHVRVTARDTTGHTASSASAGPVTVPPDTFPPEPFLSGPPEGAVVPDTDIKVAGGVDDPEARVFLNGNEVPLQGGLFQATLPLVEGTNEVTVRAVDASGNERVLRRSVTCIPLAVDTPPPGASTGADPLEVAGTCGANVRLVSVNSLAAGPAGRVFTVSPVPVVKGENILLVRAYDSEGRFSERRISITGVTTDSSTRLRASPSAGAAPLEVMLTCEPREVGSGARFSWDPDGDGITDREGIGLTGITWRFEVPGSYVPAVTVSESSGVRRRVGAAVTVHPPGRLIGSLPVSLPSGLAFDAQGRLLVSARNPDAIRIFDADLRPAGAITEGPAGVGLSAPAGLAVDEEGIIWVADSGNHRIAAFDPQGNYLGRWKWNETLFGRITNRGSEFYAAAGDGRLFRFLKTYVYGELATGAWSVTTLTPQDQGGVGGVSGLALGPSGKLLLADAASGRLLVYQNPSESNPATSYLNDLAAGLTDPSAVALGLEAGRVAVLERDGGRILLFDSGGAPAGELGPGAYGDLPPAGPSDLVLRRTCEGTVCYVADTGNDRVAIILLPGEDPLTPLVRFRDALRVGDLAAAASALHPFNREKHMTFLGQLQGRLPEAASWFERLELAGITGGLARVRAVRQCAIDGSIGDFEFPILLLESEEGGWKILDF